MVKNSGHVNNPIILEGAIYGKVSSAFQKDEVLSEIFANTVDNLGSNIALINDSIKMSYKELNAKSDIIARSIQSFVGPGSFVGLWMPRGPEVLISQIAITKLGAAWLPFDADSPPDRILVCMRDAKSLLLLTTDVFYEKASKVFIDIEFRIMTAKDFNRSFSTPSIPKRAPNARGDDPAYLIYTSGSTGVPKGIIVSQSNVCHYLRAINSVYELGPQDIMFQGASVAFDLSVEEIWLPYFVGASLWVSTTMTNIDNLADTLTHAGVTAIDTVPTLLSMITKDIPSLKLIILGGEALPAPLLRKWSHPGRRVYNTYGPTETTIVCTTWLANPDEKVSIGRPIPNYSCYVVDDNNCLKSPGEIGELLVGGPGVTQGYLGRPDLTRNKFIPNPFSSSGSAGLDPILYHTGDAVSYDDSHLLYFHGRIDDQVKIRGFRVELGDIESHLECLPGIARASVVLREEFGDDMTSSINNNNDADNIRNVIKTLIAFLEVEDGYVLDDVLLRKNLRVSLPPYMIPSRFEIVSELPRLLSSGKVDRNSLKALPLQPRQANNGNGVIEVVEEANLSKIEQLLLHAAKGVFSLPSISLSADLFTELGAHSLIVSSLISAVRKQHTIISISFEDVYQVDSFA